MLKGAHNSPHNLGSRVRAVFARFLEVGRAEISWKFFQAKLRLKTPVSQSLFQPEARVRKSLLTEVNRI